MPEVAPKAVLPMGCLPVLLPKKLASGVVAIEHRGGAECLRIPSEAVNVYD